MPCCRRRFRSALGFSSSATSMRFGRANERAAPNKIGICRASRSRARCALRFFMSDLAPKLEQFRATFKGIAEEMRKFIVGQDEVIEGVLVAFFAGGHVLLEGVPGLGKT